MTLAPTAWPRPASPPRPGVRRRRQLAQRRGVASSWPLAGRELVAAMVAPRGLPGSRGRERPGAAPPPPPRRGCAPISPAPCFSGPRRPAGEGGDRPGPRASRRWTACSPASCPPAWPPPPPPLLLIAVATAIASPVGAAILVAALIPFVGAADPGRPRPPPPRAAPSSPALEERLSALFLDRVRALPVVLAFQAEGATTSAPALGLRLGRADPQGAAPPSCRRRRWSSSPPCRWPWWRSIAASTCCACCPSRFPSSWT
ncbi:hypothetical protein ACRAWD_17910 [Caulobacter segnis]